MTDTTNTHDDGDASADADVSVDLRGEESPADTPESEPEIELQDEAAGEPRQQTDSGIPKEQIEQEGRQRAKQALEDAHGESREAQIANAADNLEDSIQDLAGELQHRRQQASRIETKQSGLALTIERLEAGADEPDRTFTRELEGGISEEILPNEREEFADRYRDRREQLGETHSQIEDRCDTLSKALERTEYARQELADMQDLLGASSPSGDHTTQQTGDVSDEELLDAAGL